MNYLSGRQNSSQGFKTSCDYYINGEKIKDISEFKNIVGYVVQKSSSQVQKHPKEDFEQLRRI